MRVIITGGCGFLGQLLARAITRQGRVMAHGDGAEAQEAVTEIILADVARPPKLLFEELEAGGSGGIVVSVKLGSVADRDFCASLFEGAASVSVFHLGAVMSGQGEANFDLCLQVNLHGIMNMLECARACAAARPRFLFASTMATIGTGKPADYKSADDVLDDSCRATPHTTYGMTKSCAELLLADYSRRGFVDGRGCRLPTIVVRAGAPNAATTSCFSGIIREPLAGVDAVMPIRPDVKHGVTGYRSAVVSLLQLHELPAAAVDERLGDDRTCFLPSTALSLADLEAALARVVTPASRSKLGKVSYAADDFLSDVIGGMPSKTDGQRALDLGLPRETEVDVLIREYAEDFPGALAPGVELTPAPPPPVKPPPGSVKVALITGGGTGIGKAVAIRLAEGGWVRGAPAERGQKRPRPEAAVAIVLTGRRLEPLRETAAACEELGATVLVHPADLTREGEVAHLLEAVEGRFGRLDLLFNNAGANCQGTTVDELDPAAWRRVIDINLTGAFLVARSAVALMKRQSPKGGRVINNGSVSAQTPRWGSAAYTASKHGVQGLTKSIALDGRSCNVACGQIDYGNVESSMTAAQAKGVPQADGEIRTEPRMGVEDAANAVEYMAGLPLEANVLTMTVMATGMPLVGRG